MKGAKVYKNNKHGFLIRREKLKCKGREREGEIKYYEYNLWYLTRGIKNNHANFDMDP